MTDLPGFHCGDSYYQSSNILRLNKMEKFCQDSTEFFSDAASEIRTIAIRQEAAEAHLELNREDMTKLEQAFAGWHRAFNDIFRSDHDG